MHDLTLRGSIFNSLWDTIEDTTDFLKEKRIDEKDKKDSLVISLV